MNEKKKIDKRSYRVTYANLASLRLHLLDKKCNKIGGALFNNELQWDNVDSAFYSHTRVTLIRNVKQRKQCKLFMADAKPIFVQGVERARSELGSVKIQCTLYAEFKIEKNGSIVGRSIKNFSTKYMRVFKTQDPRKCLIQSFIPL